MSFGFAYACFLVIGCRISFSLFHFSLNLVFFKLKYLSFHTEVYRGSFSLHRDGYLIFVVSLMKSLVKFHEKFCRLDLTSFHIAILKMLKCLKFIFKASSLVLAAFDPNLCPFELIYPINFGT